MAELERLDTFELGSFNLEKIDLEALLAPKFDTDFTTSYDFDFNDQPLLKPLPPSPTAVLKSPATFLPLPNPSTNDNFINDFNPFASSDCSGGAMDFDTTSAVPTFDNNEQPEEPVAAAPVAAPKGKPGRKPRTKKTPEEIKERVRAKNRRAQARYREKLKAERQTTKSEVENMVNEVERLRLENTELETNNDVMGRVLAVREHVSNLLESTTDANTMAGLLPPLASQLRYLRQAPEYKQQLPIYNLRSSGTTTTTTTTGGCSSSHQCPLTGLSLAEVRALQGAPAQKVADHFASYVSRIKAALPPMCCNTFPRCSCAEAGIPLPDAPPLVKDILFETGCLCFENAIHNPTAIQTLLAANIHQTDANDATLRQRYATVVSALRISPEQLAQLIPAKERFAKKMVAIAETRRRLLLKLIQIAPNVPLTVRGFAENAIGSLELNALTTDLTINIQEETVACGELAAATFGAVLSPMQKALALIGSYPAFPDMYSICDEAEKLGNGSRKLLAQSSAE